MIMIQFIILCLVQAIVAQLAQDAALQSVREP